ncbi:unnamed protein product [Rotaria sp. Silwood2]|nr:unnamed protein product [Rotaria sp. Silwood2]
MVEPDKKDHNKTADLEDTVRNLREENAKLLQLLRSQGLLLDSSTNQNGKSSDTIFPISNQQKDSTNLTFDQSDITLTTNSINTINQINHQHINNHGSINQQTFNGQTVHGNQSNITPNFNTVIQTTSQPFVQNSSNTLVQNNTNLIQPINLVNFNNVSLDSIQSFLASQNSVVYLSQTSSSSSSSTTTTTSSSTNSIITNTNVNEALPSNTHSILPSSSSLLSEQHQISIRPKLSLLHQHQELVPVIPKIKPEHYESITKQLSSSSSTTINNDTTNLIDNDSNDSKYKYQRPIRPKPSSRTNSLKSYKSVVVNKTKSSSSSAPTTNAHTSSSSCINNNNNSPTLSIFSSPICLSPSFTTATSYLSQPSSLDHQIDLLSSSQLINSKSLDSSTTSLPTPANNKSSKNRIRNCNKKTSSISSTILSSNNSTLIPIAPNNSRPSAPAIVNVQRLVTSNNSIRKRTTTNKKQSKRNTKTFVHSHSESILQQNSSSPINTFAESISGFLESFDQELIASNFLSQSTTSNLLTNENNSIISSDHIDLQHIVNNNNTVQGQQQDAYQSLTTTAASISMPTLDEFNNRLENETILTNQTINDLQTTHDYNVENEQITSFMNEEDMRFVEMNFDENIFLKQFDLDDPGIKLNIHSDQNIFANILTNNNHNNNDILQIEQQQQQQNQTNEQSITHQNQHPTPPPPIYPGSSLINNNVFTTLVPLGSQQQTLKTNAFNYHNSTMSLLPEEGVQLTARHIEPSQVATYESAKYQDILDDLVMVTDQDALRHAQATAANDPSVVSTDYSFALLEAANEIMKNTNIHIVEENSTAFTDLQYFYPIQQEQTNLEKQLETYQNKEQNEPEQQQQQQQPIVILEKLHSEILTSTNLTENVLNDSISDLLQYNQTHSPIDHERSTIELTTPLKNLSNNLLTKSPNNCNNNNNSPLSLTNTYDNDQTLSYSPISDIITISTSSLQQKLQSIESMIKSPVIFEPISSPSSPSSPIPKEIILDSGHLNELNFDKINSLNNNNNNDDDDEIEELLRDTTNTNNNQYEIIENQGQTSIKNSIIIDNIDELIEIIEPSLTTRNPKCIELFEHTFLRYKQKYYLNLKHQQNLTLKNLTIPNVKLKLPTEKIVIKEQSLEQHIEQESVERPPLKITIRAKLSGTNLLEDKIQNKTIRKIKKKKSHHHENKKKSNNNNNNDNNQFETEYAGLTRFEQPLAQLYHQPSPPTSDEPPIPKTEILTSSPLLLTSQQNDLQTSTTNIHSGFMINEQTPPSSIISIEHKQSPPPLLISQMKHEKLKTNYSHLLDYDDNNNTNDHHHHHHHQNNNTFITPPPEIDLNLIQQKSNTYENFCQFSNSPNKKKSNRRKSSVTSSTSSKSLTNLDYAIDTQELEPVSPTPLLTMKQKHLHNQTSASNYNDTSPPYCEHQQQKHVKEYHSRKSSNRPSKTTSSQNYQQPRSLSNHNYRTLQEPPLMPPILPVPPPPIHIDPYAQTYHPFAPRVPPPPPPFFNFPFPHPFLNPHAPTTSTHFHPHSMKYHHHIHPSHIYPQQYPYHAHLQRQQQYNNSNYMSSRDHHSFDR